MTSKTAIVASLLLAATLPALSHAASKIVRIEEKSFDFSRIDKVEVRTQGGAINVVGGNSDDGRVRVEKVFRNASESEADSMESKIERTFEVRGNVLYVDFKYEKESSLWGFLSRRPALSFNIEVDCASNVDIDLKTSGGPIDVENVEGEVVARTSGGPMQFKQIGGQITAHTSGGPIRATDVEGRVELTTSGGPITVNSIAGNSRLKTSGGPIKALDVRGPLDAKTSGGNITATFPNGIDSDTRLHTSGGGITARLPRDERFFLNAHTSGGGVQTQFPVEYRGERKRSHAEGNVNGGGPRLDLHSSGGGIRVDHL